MATSAVETQTEHVEVNFNDDDGRSEELSESTWPSSDLTARPCLASAASNHFSGFWKGNTTAQNAFPPSCCSVLSVFSAGCHGSRSGSGPVIIDQESWVYIFGSGTKLYVTDEAVVKPVVSVYPAASRAHLEGKTSCYVWPQVCLSSGPVLLERQDGSSDKGEQLDLEDKPPPSCWLTEMLSTHINTTALSGTRRAQWRPKYNERFQLQQPPVLQRESQQS
ncbi:uncharacterized protein AKAME5_002485600 [Lates japonicus]|uniref:Uncharacterized protein n=1 Tax=Lates japonicus TaxID=270547 RepID=A0AAD3RM57_LATJO|nr:uncharacterized protein AKAME5_002485600 [Lates japonicus]